MRPAVDEASHVILRVGLIALMVLAGCRDAQQAPLALVDQVDLTRFMGDWYVTANIPTFIEEGAHNAIESYRLAADGTIETTFSFRAGSFDGESKRYTPRGFVQDHPSNAIWTMQFVWPLRADYRIAYLNSDYTQTVIGREKRDYVWIMARTAYIPQAEYDSILRLLAEQGYAVSRIRKVPQRWNMPSVVPGAAA